MWSGPTHTGKVAEPSRKNTETAFPTNLSGQGVYVLDRFMSSHRKASSSGPTSYETHTWQLESTGISREGDPNSQVPASPFTMVARRRQCTHRPTITPNKTCSADIYRRIKRRVERSLRRAHSKRNLVPSGKQVAYILSGSKSSLSRFKRVPRLLLKQDSTCSNRNTRVVSYINKEGGMRSGPLCALLWSILTWFQKTSDSQPHSRPTECGSRQAIQARPDHSNGVVSTSRGLPINMQQVALAPNRPICHHVQQQVASVCVTGSPGHSSGCTQSAMGGSDRIHLPISSHIK